MKASKLAKLLRAEGLEVGDAWEATAMVGASVSLGPHLVVEIIDKPDRHQAVKGPLCLHTFNPDGERFYSFGEVKKLVEAAKRIIKEASA